jgi:hypothetical protein
MPDPALHESRAADIGRYVMIVNKFLHKIGVATALLVGLVALGGVATTARADDCYHKIQTREWKLREAIERHGPYSWEARHERNELAKAQISCNVR